MLLTIDIGNSNITFGAFANDGKLLFVSRMRTDPSKMKDEYAVAITQTLRLHGCEGALSGAAISSVVPPLTQTFTDGLREFFGVEPLVVGPGIKTGFDIKIDSPSQLGADFVATTAGALAEFEPPIIVVDLGTATKTGVITSGGVFIGGTISPGVNISLEALSSRTAQLPSIGLEKPRAVIGKNTVDSMRSGVIFGTAAMVDGLAARIEGELGMKCTLVLTGGLSGLIADCCTSCPAHRPNLILEGLRTLYAKNAK